MGSIVVYRYRPMRLVPTITTRAFIATGSVYCVAADIMSVSGGRQQAKRMKIT